MLSAGAPPLPEPVSSAFGELLAHFPPAFAARRSRSAFDTGLLRNPVLTDTDAHARGFQCFPGTVRTAPGGGGTSVAWTPGVIRMRRKTKLFNHNGFTLVEMLISVGIVDYFSIV